MTATAFDWPTPIEPLTSTPQALSEDRPAESARTITARSRLHLVPALGDSPRPVAPGPFARAVAVAESTPRCEPPMAVAGAPASVASGADLETLRRRRFLVALALTVAIIGFCQLAGISLTGFPGEAGPTAEGSQVEMLVHVVAAGETYASVAADAGLAPAHYAGLLRAANGGGELVVGQRIVVDLNQLR